MGNGGIGMGTADYSEVDWYIGYLRDHGRRPTTLRNMEILLKHIMDVLAEDGRPNQIALLTDEDVEWLTRTLKVKESTLAEYIRLLSRMSIKMGGTDWGKRLDILFNRTDPDRVWITVEQFAALCAEAGATDRMILVLGACMGLRRMEIAGLRDDDVDLHTMKMTIRGKGHGPDGLVSVMDIPEEVADEILMFRRYKATHHNPPEDDDDHLVQTVYHGRWSPMSPYTVSRRVSDLGKRCGIKVTAHSLRRLYATTLTEHVGADYDTVRRLMRHADISTTLRCYIEANPVKMRQAQAGLMGIYREALCIL